MFLALGVIRYDYICNRSYSLIKLYYLLTSLGFYNGLQLIQQLAEAMCFPSMYRLKSLISIGIIITLLIGIALLYVLVYSFIISSITAQVQPEFRTLLIAIFLTSSLLMILSSLSGIYGLIRRKNKFVIVYAVTMGIYMATFLTLAIITLQSPQFIESQCTETTGSQSEFNSTSMAAKDLLCKQQCRCYFTNTQGYSDQELVNFGLTNYTTNQTALPVNAQNCPTWDNNTYTLTIQFTILESFFNCSGWCQSNPNPYYLFTNINFGKPQYTCVSALSDFLQSFGHIIEISSFTVSGFLAVVVLIIVCLWLHPDRGLKYDSLQMFKNTLIFVQETREEQLQMQ